MAEGKVPISIRDTDIVGDCIRLNRRFELDEQRIYALESAGAFTAPLASPATAFLAATTSYLPVHGMAVTLTRPGWWKIDVTVRCLLAALDTGSALYVAVTAAGTQLPGVIVNLIAGAGYIVVSRSWLYKSPTGTEQIVVVAKKTGGTGASNVDGSASSATQTSQVIAVWVGPDK